MGEKGKIMKKIIGLIIVLSLLFSSTVLASDEAHLTPYEIDEILSDVEPIELSSGVYLRDNGTYSMVDIDVSQFETNEEQYTSNEKPETFEMISSWSWDLSTPYYGSFKAKYRVLSNQTFTGYDEFYAEYFDVKCPSDSKWQAALYLPSYNKVAAYDWFDSSKTSCNVKFYNLNKDKEYRVAFEKTDNDSEATGNLKVYLK